MKKFFATFLAVALVAVACCVFASAEDTNLALNKSYDINGYDYDPTNVNYQDNETGKLTDGQIGEVAPWSEGFPFVGFSGAESTTPQAEHNGLTSSIVLDLGAESDVSKFVVHVTGGVCFIYVCGGATLRTRLDQHGNGTKTAPERRQYLSGL